MGDSSAGETARRNLLYNYESCDVLCEKNHITPACFNRCYLNVGVCSYYGSICNDVLLVQKSVLLQFFNIKACFRLSGFWVTKVLPFYTRIAAIKYMKSFFCNFVLDYGSIQ